MFDEQDQEHGLVITLVVGIAVAVSLFTIAVALAVTGVVTRSGDGVTTATSEFDHAENSTRIVFAQGSAELPDTAGGALFMLVVAAVVDPSRHIEVSGRRDPREPHVGGPAAADLATARIDAVVAALEAAGIPGARIERRRPVDVPVDADPAESRGVRLVLR